MVLANNTTLIAPAGKGAGKGKGKTNSRRTNPPSQGQNKRKEVGPIASSDEVDAASDSEDDDDDEMDAGSTRAPSEVGDGKKSISSEQLLKMRAGRAEKGSLCKRLQLIFPPRQMQKRFLKDKAAPTVPLRAGIYGAASVEVILEEVIAAACLHARQERKASVSARHIMAAIRNDEELARIFRNVSIAQGGTGGHQKTMSAVAMENPTKIKKTTKKKALQPKTSKDRGQTGKEKDNDHSADEQESANEQPELGSEEDLDDDDDDDEPGMDEEDQVGSKEGEDSEGNPDSQEY